jgi:hypothetical protein
VSRDIELFRLLTNIVGVLDQSESQDDGALASFTPRAANRQARALALKGIDVLSNGNGAEPTSSDAQSSFAIESMAKGSPKITVKAYSGSPIEPAYEQATRTWRRALDELVNGTVNTEEVQGS